jgi:hypothetical protein
MAMRMTIMATTITCTTSIAGTTTITAILPMLMTTNELPRT